MEVSMQSSCTGNGVIVPNAVTDADDGVAWLGLSRCPETPVAARRRAAG